MVPSVQHLVVARAASQEVALLPSLPPWSTDSVLSAGDLVSLALSAQELVAALLGTIYLDNQLLPRKEA